MSTAFHTRGDAALSADLGVSLTDNPLKRRGVLSITDEVSDICPIDTDAAAAAEVNVQATSPVPLVKLGQGDYAREVDGKALSREATVAELVGHGLGTAAGRTAELLGIDRKAVEKRCDLLRQRNEALACGIACLESRAAVMENEAFKALPSETRAAIYNAIESVVAEYDKAAKQLREQYEQCT